MDAFFTDCYILGSTCSCLFGSAGDAFVISADALISRTIFVIDALYTTCGSFVGWTTNLPFSAVFVGTTNALVLQAFFGRAGVAVLALFVFQTGHTLTCVGSFSS